MLERDGDFDSAAALMYESAKQCINALANQEGGNPGSSAAKERFLHDVANRPNSPLNLFLQWKSATQLHIHADRGHLEDEEFTDRWALTHLFIENMLLLYAGNQ